MLSPSLLDAARRRALDAQTGADQVLVRWGVIDEQAYLERLAASLGLDMETFAGVGRDDIMLDDGALLTAIRFRMLTLRDGFDLVSVIAPTHFTARRLAEIGRLNPQACSRIRLATRTAFDAFVSQQAGAVIAREAIDGLAGRSARLSAAPQDNGASRLPRLAKMLGVGSALALMLVVVWVIAFEAASIVAAAWFFAFAMLRLVASIAPRSHAPPFQRLRDDELPVYSVVVALYREASSVETLIQSLSALDYPAEKLNIILAVEPDDLATRAAIARARTHLDLQVVIAATEGPRTKPKALNCALPFATGTFIAVYDAEDRPDPGQLRAALDVFRSHGVDVACAQASLCIENFSDSHWARMFAAEYAGQFDVFLPGAAALKMPLPLGGSSNHFRACTLRDVGAWDPYNVTEDADLGLRLARLGYRSVTFDSTTYEEAPVAFGAWLRQRTRWMKGWMQTWIVHMRSPRRLWREAGARGFVAINLVIGGNVLTALAHLFLVVELAYAGGVAMLSRNPLSLTGFLIVLHVTAFASAWVSTFIIGAAGLARRGLNKSVWILLLAPLYWIALSVAAWRALFQLLTDPYRWEKTEHGLARRRHFTKPPETGMASREAPRWLKRPANVARP